MKSKAIWTTVASMFLWSATPALEAAEKEKELTELQRYISESARRPQPGGTAAGSLWSPEARLFDLAADLRAGRPGDVVTILVEERSVAVAKGTVKTARASAANASVTAAGGITRPLGPWRNLLGVSSQQQLDGEGATSRETVLATTLTGRVVDVLPNGFLVVEAAKTLQVNSEHQTVVVRGIVRPFDITTGNVVLSDRLAQLEVQVNGKGVIGDAIRRPFFLYRLLLGLLPF